MKTNVIRSTTGRISIVLGVAMTVVSLFYAQMVDAQNYKLSTYQLKVSGTSNVHDWTMKATNATSSANFVVKAASAPGIATLNGLELSLPVKGLKSNSELMDTRTYSTLNADKHQRITFKLNSANLTPQGGNKYIIQATGNLTIAGVTKEVALTSAGLLNADKSITVMGKKKIKMSDWKIKPPSFMLGAMKVGDEVTIDWNLKFQD